MQVKQVFHFYLTFSSGKTRASAAAEGISTEL